jgi:hypothetical protein
MLDSVLSLPKWQLMIRSGAAQKPNFCIGPFDLPSLVMEQSLAQVPLMGTSQWRACRLPLPSPCSLWYLPHPVSVSYRSRPVRDRASHAAFNTLASVKNHHLGGWPGDACFSGMQELILTHIALATTCLSIQLAFMECIPSQHSKVILCTASRVTHFMCGLNLATHKLFQFKSVKCLAHNPLRLHLLICYEVVIRTKFNVANKGADIY